MIDVWITFNSVSQLQCGGLERCNIWFQKPTYTFVYRDFEYDSLPFGGGDQRQGLCAIGWRYSETNGKETGSISLGKVFGYNNKISDYVWGELCKFFESEDLRQWDTKDKNPKDFILKMSLDFKFTV